MDGRLLGIWYGEGGGWLRPLASVFGMTSAFRRALYRGGWLRSWRAPVPVVVVPDRHRRAAHQSNVSRVGDPA